ncbi:MAG: HflK protein, partial [Verrucomicrobiota bacterium]
MNEQPINIQLPQFDVPMSTIRLLVIGLLLLSAGMTSVYSVPAESVAVVLRFGKYIRDVEPGLRFKLPWGIDQITIIPVERQLKQEFGFPSSGSTDPD